MTTSAVWQKTIRVFLASALGLFPPVTGRAQEADLADLAEMTLEDLINVKITSVSKREQRLSRTAAAVFVIGQDDIRRSGATNIPDLLRMAPGVNVERIDANAWAISVRGFNARYSNKVLVLVDGRTVYTPTFSGVYWDNLDMPLANIERIEIIRGPGATVWGANAVNGVISIITKSSARTLGTQVTAGAGSHLNGLGQVQHGGEVGKSGTYRIFGKAFRVGNSATASGSTGNDRWSRANAGFRSDWALTDRDSLTVLGDVFQNRENQTIRSSHIATPFDSFFHESLEADGGNLLARWKHTLSGGSQTIFQTYYDASSRTDYGMPKSLRTFDLDFQHHLNAGYRHDLVWGVGYRVISSYVPAGFSISMTPPARTDGLFNTFLQDDFRISGAFTLTLGLRLEHNMYTGWETEPSVRLAWNPPGSTQTIWAAASRAIRQPARSDTDLGADLSTFPLSANSVGVLRLVGNPNLGTEELKDAEVGYRADLAKRLSLDVVTFVSLYRDLLTYEPGPRTIVPGVPATVLMLTTFDNKAGATNFGSELFVNWQAKSHWRLSPGFAYLHANLYRYPSSQGNLTSTLATNFPGKTFQLRSQWNLRRSIEFDQSFYYRAQLPGATNPGRARLDLRVARPLGEWTEVSIVGQNLLRPRTLEYGDANAVVGTQTLRSVYGQITWKF